MSDNSTVNRKFPNNINQLPYKMQTNRYFYLISGDKKFSNHFSVTFLINQ